MDGEAVKKAEDALRSWLKNSNRVGEDSIESASYDPPWTPGPRRRNEVLIRLQVPAEPVSEAAP
jgi:hypothetical protein